MEKRGKRHRKSANEEPREESSKPSSPTAPRLCLDCLGVREEKGHECPPSHVGEFQHSNSVRAHLEVELDSCISDLGDAGVSEENVLAALKRLIHERIMAKKGT